MIGFSFRDEHINEIFSNILNRGKRIIVVSPSADRNIYGNLLRKDVPHPLTVIYHRTDESLSSSFGENNQVISINQPLSVENSTRVFDMLSTIMGLLNVNAGLTLDDWKAKSIKGEVCGVRDVKMRLLNRVQYAQHNIVQIMLKLIFT